MDRTFFVAAVVFVVLAVVGVLFVVNADSLSASDPQVFESVGSALLAAGLAAFLVEGFRWDRARRRW